MIEITYKLKGRTTAVNHYEVSVDGKTWTDRVNYAGLDKPEVDSYAHQWREDPRGLGERRPSSPAKDGALYTRNSKSGLITGTIDFLLDISPCF